MQKTDSRDAYCLLELLLKDRFLRIWTPSPSERDVRQLLRHRYKLVCLRTSVGKLWTAAGRKQLENLALGPVKALAFVAKIGPIGRFGNSKQVVSYLVLNARVSSSGGKQRLSSISKQGNSMLRFLLVEATLCAGCVRAPVWGAVRSVKGLR